MFDGLLVDLPANEIFALSQRADVVSIDPTEGGEVANMSHSRALMSSDPYFNLNLNSGFVAVLDSGVRTNKDHVLLTGRITLALDCVNGGATCNNTQAAGYSPWDTLNHGNAVAAIVTGTNALGNDFRGVTAVGTDSFKVTFGSTINFTAVDRAYLRAAAFGDAITNA